MARDPGALLASLATDTARELWKIADGDDNVAGVVMPRYGRHRAKDATTEAGLGELRLSEQEARFAFARLAVDRGYLVSIETPTIDRYSFSRGEESIGRSAQHDLSLYEHDRTLLAHVEFKQGGMDTVEKDLSKLIGSKQPALFFHSYASKRDVRLKYLLDGYASTLKELQSRDDYQDVAAPIVLAFCSVFHHPRCALVRAGVWSELPTLLSGGPDGAAWETITP